MSFVFSHLILLKDLGMILESFFLLFTKIYVISKTVFNLKTAVFFKIKVCTLILFGVEMYMKLKFRSLVYKWSLKYMKSVWKKKMKITDLLSKSYWTIFFNIIYYTLLNRPTEKARIHSKISKVNVYMNENPIKNCAD